MHKICLTFSSWKTFILSQSLASWPHFPMQAHRSEHNNRKASLLCATNCWNKMRFSVVAGLYTTMVRKKPYSQSNWLYSSSVQLYTGTSGTKGWGACWLGRWLQHRWSPAQCLMNIAWRELFAMLVAVHIWGILGPNKRLYFTVITWNIGKGNYPWPHIIYSSDASTLLQSYSIQYIILFCVMHISGANNNAADALSHFQMTNFTSSPHWRSKL